MLHLSLALPFTELMSGGPSYHALHSIAEIKRKVCREVVGHVMGFHPALSNLGLLKTDT